jgi:hypothetical protein
MNEEEIVEYTEFSKKLNLKSTNHISSEDTQNKDHMKLEEKIRINIQAILTGKSPIRLVEKEGKINWKQPICKDINSSFSDVLKTITATTDHELASEIFDKGRHALPNQERLSYNANLALQSLADLSPKDSIEARLCLQATALYSQGMQYLSRAESSDMLCHSEFYMKCAIKLLRLHNETVEAINKSQRGSEQRIIVQHVNVNDGGKAIVGAVHSRG